MSHAPRLNALLDDLRVALDADVAIAFRVVVAPDGIGRAVGLCTVGDPAMHAVLDAFEGIPLARWGFDLGALPVTNRWAARTAATVPAFVRELAWVPFGIQSQLGFQAALPTPGGPQVWGFLGVLRRRAPEYAEADAAAFPARRVLARLQAVVDAEPAAPAAPRRVVLTGGAVTMAEAGARDLLEVGGRRAAVEAGLRAPRVAPERFGWAEGAPYEACALEGDDGPAWLVTLLPLRRFEASVLLSLSPTERRVAELAAAGATVAEIAAAIGRSENTVKTHLRRVYAATGVATRAELLALVRDAVPPGARG